MNWSKKLMPLILLDLLKKTDYNARIKDIEGKMPSITNLASTAALNAVENNLPNVSNLVKKNKLRCKNKRHSDETLHYF